LSKVSLHYENIDGKKSYRITYNNEYGKRIRIRVGANETYALKIQNKVIEWLDEGLDPIEEYKNESSKSETTSETKLTFLNKKVSSVDWRDFINLCNTNQEVIENASYTQDVVKIQIDTDKPVAIAWSADWHLGSLFTDYKSWQEDLEFILQTKNLYMATVGDLSENFPAKFKSARAPLQQILAPEHQQSMLEGILTELVQNEKLLMAAKGNHDVDFDEQLTGQSQIKRFMSRLVPFFNGKGFAQIMVGSEMYTVLMVHKTRFNSYMHALHGIKQEYKETIPADIVVGAHTHKPGFECYHHYDMSRDLGYIIKTGTYKVEDEFSKSFWTKGVVGVPTTLLFPHTHKIMIFSNAQDAAAHLSLYD